MDKLQRCAQPIEKEHMEKAIEIQKEFAEKDPWVGIQVVPRRIQGTWFVKKEAFFMTQMIIAMTYHFGLK